MTDDDPITLDDACLEIFHGTIKRSALLAQADRGNLVIFQIGRRYFTTRADVQEMILRCRARNPRHGSSSIGNAERGPSETDRITSAQAALKQMLQEQKKPSKPISPPSISRNEARRH